MAMTKVKSEKVFAGAIFDVFRETWTNEMGASQVRDVVRKPPAVAVLAFDEDGFWVVYQAREAVGDPQFMELPAGRLDVEGESELDAAKRELEEEVGVRAEVWEQIGRFYTSPGFTDEEVVVYAATVADHRHRLEPCERPAADDATTPVLLPLDELEDTRELCDDAKTLVALGWLVDRLAEQRAARDAENSGGED